MEALNTALSQSKRTRRSLGNDLSSSNRNIFRWAKHENEQEEESEEKRRPFGVSKVINELLETLILILTERCYGGNEKRCSKNKNKHIFLQLQILHNIYLTLLYPELLSLEKVKPFYCQISNQFCM